MILKENIFRVVNNLPSRVLQANNDIITTYKELFRACNVSESTGYLLLKGLKRITTETVRVGRTWKTKFTIRVHTLRKEVFTIPLGNTGIKKGVLDVVRRVSRVGFPAGLRNEGAFMMPLGLKSCGFGETAILDDFARAFSLSEYSGDHRFTEREMKKTVRSALKEKYRYCNVFAFKKKERRETWSRFLKGITNLECELLRKIASGGETWQS